jgi:hypothetical protein
MIYHLQVVAGVPLLGAALFAALLALALGPLETVTGRRFAAVPAVLVHLAFQLPDPRFEDSNLEFEALEQVPDQGDHRLEPLVVDGPNLLIR